MPAPVVDSSSKNCRVSIATANIGCASTSDEELTLSSRSVVMLGATGAVGNHVALTLASLPAVERLTLLGRRPANNVVGDAVSQSVVDIFDPDSYGSLAEGHRAAVCALGVGQPSKMSKEKFVRIDRDAVIDFATVCKHSGVEHFELLSSIGVNAESKSFYLRSKGQLEASLKSLKFKRLSLFHPSMIMTPTNRYGLSQAITLKAMPLVNPLLMGSLRKFRGIPVHRLGQAMAMNIIEPGEGLETLHWDDFMELSHPDAVGEAAKPER